VQGFWFPPSLSKAAKKKNKTKQNKNPKPRRKLCFLLINDLMM
jgi:hypothetical protein